MWEYALWGLLGAAVNRGLVFLEASQKVKGWPFTAPHGPGGLIYAVSVAVHMGIAAATTAAVATTGIITSGFVAFGIGVGATVVVKKATRSVLALLPAETSRDPQLPPGGADNAPQA